MSDAKGPESFDFDAWEDKVRDVPAPVPGPDRDSVPVLVDSPEAQRDGRSWLASRRAAELRPIIPAWLRSRAQVRDTARWAARYALHKAGYHAARTPTYGARLAARAPAGVARGLRAWGRWVCDAEGRPVREACKTSKDGDLYRKLAELRDKRVRFRAGLSAVVAAAMLAVLVALRLAAPAPLRLLVFAGIVGLLGKAGQPADKPLIERAVDLPEAPRLTSPEVTKALCSIGVAGINQAVAKDPKAIGFLTPIAMEGKGYLALVSLPAGVVVGDVIERRDRLASALDRQLGCVWPEPVPRVSPRRLALYVSHEDMATAKQPLWPLAKSGQADLFRAFPFGTDQRGRQAPLTLMFASMVVGAVPRQGKTFAVRLMALAAALDPLAELHLYDLKGTGDFRPLEPVAYRYRRGDDDRKGDVEYGLADLRELADELRRRADVIGDLPSDLCPENKVTPELARNKALRLHPIVLIVDECQCWFEHAEYGEEIKAICADLVKRGPAVGIMVVFSTQRPDDGSLPAKIRDNAVRRFCLKVTDAKANNMVLGSGAYGSGIQATMFSVSDKGIGYLVGEGDDPVILRTYYVDQPAAERIVARARLLRERAGTLSGHAIGEDPKAQADAAAQDGAVLEDVLSPAVLAPGEDELWTETALERLQGFRQAVYGVWSRQQLVAVLKRHGVDTDRQINVKTPEGKVVNRRGFWRQDVLDALARQRRRRGEGAA